MQMFITLIVIMQNYYFGMFTVYCLLPLSLSKRCQHLLNASAGLGSAETVVGAMEPLFQECTTPGTGGVLGTAWEALWGRDVTDLKWALARERGGHLMPNGALKHPGRNKSTDKQIFNILWAAFPSAPSGPRSPALCVSPALCRKTLGAQLSSSLSDLCTKAHYQLQWTKLWCSHACNVCGNSDSQVFLWWGNAANVLLTE